MTEKKRIPAALFNIRTIRARLLIAFVLMVLLPAAVITCASAIVSFQGGYTQIINQLDSIATLKEAEIHTWLSGLQLDLGIELTGNSSLSRLRTLLQASPDSSAFVRAYHVQRMRFNQTIALRHSFDELFLMDPRGRVILSTRPSVQGEYRGLQAYFKEGLKTAGVHVQTLSFSSISEGINTIVAVMPVLDDNGHALGVLAGRASLAMLNEIMFQRVGLSETGETYLVGSNQVLLTQSRFPGYEPGKKYVKSIGVNAAIKDHMNGSGIYADYRGVPVLSVYRWLPDLQVALVAEQDRMEALRPLYTTLGIDAGVALFAVMVAVVLSIFISGSIARPVADLAQTAERIAAGSLELRAKVERDGEIGVLARSFNSMTAQLHGLITSLEQRVAERTTQLTMAKEQAEAANLAKSTFLANMSHELRTPLNAVLGFSQLMKGDPDVSVKQRESLEIINRSGEYLLNLINNVLDISKIESGRVVLEQAPMDLHQLLHEMKSLMYAKALAQGLSFTVEQSPDLPRHITIDQGKLRQVLINLIGNAVKYTKTGGVSLRAMVVKKETSECMRLEFEVEDTGPGIRGEDRERIFFPFVQLGVLPPTEAGTGLGLAICKQYVELMGGTISVASAPGKGSLFRFEIPVGVLPAGAIPTESRRGRVIGLAEGQPRYRLLIAEDQPENRLLLHEMLEPLGFDLREAVNGKEALALFEEWHPHLVWMDIRMPVMDGLEATWRIKATETGAGTRIVALTAHALEEERSEIMAAGCDDFIRKPYKYDDILDVLTRNLGVRFIYEEGATPPAASTAQPDTAALAALPMELLDALEHALSLLDIGGVNRTIEDIRARDVSLGEALEAMAGDFQYNRILRLIRTAHGDAGLEKLNE